MLQWINKILGDPNERKIKKFDPTLDVINRFEEELESLSDEELKAKTEQFKKELADRPRDSDPKLDYKYEQEALEWILPEAFAVVREASRRAIGLRHYDVQMVGGLILHQGSIAEMRTGEGKTLVATLPAYLNALTGNGVHVITVNDYLAKRDAEWMGAVYKFLGLSVGVVLSEQRGFDSFQEKKYAYGCDITYGTNNEFGFDYLRDNMAGSKTQMVQRPYSYAIIDEVDSILIDEARTPLIISGRLEQSAETYQAMAQLAPQLKVEDHYTIDEKARNIILTEDGIDEAQALLKVDDLFDPRTNYAHHLLQALKAKELFRHDIDYVVKDNEIVIVDEFTGRMMEGRRWSDGLHQAIEAKEGVHIQDETQTLASITFQNLFRLYPKLSGMTGTALTEEAEFGKIYNLEVTAIPTNRKDQRLDGGDMIYKTEKIKFYKVIEEIIELHKAGNPVLVGTTSIEKSEWLSTLLSTPQEMTKHLRDKSARLATVLEGKTELQEHLRLFLKNPEASSGDELAKIAEDKKTPSDHQDFLLGMADTADAVQAIRKGVPHHVLNAKLHEQEANIVSQAGRLGAVTIATNMAGRGTDIVLGGNPEFLAREHFLKAGRNMDEVTQDEFDAIFLEKEKVTATEKEKVIEAGGLHILGTERHESRRIDNQLRGRAARQGDPGSTRFYLSLEDTLMRIFGGDKVSSLMEFLNVDETMPITAPMVTKVIEGAQRKVEAYHFEIRKNVLKYDDVLTEQRKLIYGQRKRVLEGYKLRESIVHMVELEMERCVTAYLVPEGEFPDWEEDVTDDLLAHLHAKVPQLAQVDIEKLKELNTYPALIEYLVEEGRKTYENIELELVKMAEELDKTHGVKLMGLSDEEDDESIDKLKESLNEEELEHYHHPLRRIERDILLSVIDAKWIDYLHNLDALREGIGLRAYGQKDPLMEYKREAFELFQNLTFEIQRETVSLLFRARIEIQLEQQSGVNTALTDAEQIESNGDAPDLFQQAASSAPKNGKKGSQSAASQLSGKKKKAGVKKK